MRHADETLRRGRPLARRLTDAGVYAVLTVFAVLTLVPFFWLAASSLKTTGDFFSSQFLPPGRGFLGIGWERLTLGNFRRAFLEFDLARAFLNSVFLASVSSVGATLFSALGGYALAKFEFPGRRLLQGLVLSALVIPGALLIAPGYRLIHQLGLLDTYAGLLLPGMAPAFGVFLFRQTMLRAVPDDLLEAARMDGCGEGRIFFTIVIPLVRPMLGAFVLLTFLGAWNNFIGPQVILSSPERFPLSVAIAQVRGLYGQDYGLLTAATLVSIAPVMALFLWLQKEFIAGLTAGSGRG